MLLKIYGAKIVSKNGFIPHDGSLKDIVSADYVTITKTKARKSPPLSVATNLPAQYRQVYPTMHESSNQVCPK